jgi:hypothetical protein
MSSRTKHPCEFIESVVSGSEAFLVDAEDGTRVGVVDEILFDDAGRVAQIDVCSGWFGRRRWAFDLADVVVVSPSQRLLVVSDASIARLKPPG